MNFFTKFNKLVFITALLLSANAFSIHESALSSLNEKKFESLNPQDKELYATIVDKEVVEVYPRYDLVEEALLGQEKAAGGGIGEVIMIADKLLALGQKIWKIVEAGRPVSNANFTKPVSIIPNMSDVNGTFTSMTNWKMPMVKSFRVAYKNGFGSEVVSFVYTVVFQYGGKFEGKGSYITGLFVTASNVSVSWGFNFNASSEIMSITNQGSADEPIASAVVNIKYKVSSVLKSIDESDIFFVNGQGMLQRMNY